MNNKVAATAIKRVVDVVAARTQAVATIIICGRRRGVPYAAERRSVDGRRPVRHCFLMAAVDACHAITGVGLLLP